MLEGMKRLCLSLSILLCLSFVSAHATLVLVEMTLEPTTPTVEAPFQVALELIDPFQVPVEDAIIRLEARPIRENDSVPTDAPIIVMMQENSAGRYEAMLNLSQSAEKSSRWKLFFRDQTYAYEEATKNVDIALEQPYDAPIEFIFPPTQTKPRSIWTWLGWLIGLPVGVAAFVTIAVIVSHNRDKAKAQAA